VGSIAGFQNFGSQVGNLISPIAIGLFLTFSNNSYLGPMIFAAVSCLISASIYAFWVRIKPVKTLDEVAALRPENTENHA
jgi:ACS family D-galactonate transporter-like MFS transporter